MDTVYIKKLPDDVRWFQVTRRLYVVFNGARVVPLGVQVIAILAIDVLQTICVVLVGTGDLQRKHPQHCYKCTLHMHKDIRYQR